jgi:hypothetical protein
MTAPSGATSTLGAVGTPATPATELLIFSPEVDPVFLFFYIKKNCIYLLKNP